MRNLYSKFNLLSAIILLIINLSVSAQKGAFTCGDSITDTRDGHKYKTVLIGKQCWMAQNMNIGTQINGYVSQTNNGIIEKYCYDDNASNCSSFGGLYVWNEAMNYSASPASRGICPTGWHLATDAEWINLEYYEDPTIRDDSTGVNGCTMCWWRGTYGGQRLQIGGVSGFDGLLAGSCNQGGYFGNLNSLGYYWTSSSYNADSAWSHAFNNSDGKSGRAYGTKTTAKSVRCINDLIASADNLLKGNNFIRISPNPASDYINIEISQISNLKTSYLTFEIFDILGNKLYSENFKPQTANYKQKVDIHLLSSGIYFLKLSGENSTITKKFLKQ